MDTLTAASAGSTFSAINGGNAATWNAGDSVNGGGKANVSLFVNDSGSAGWTATGAGAPQVSGVQTVTFSTPNALTADTTSGYTGLTQLNANATGAETITAATSTNVTANGSAAVTINGGNAVNVQSAGGNVSVGQTTAGVGAVTVTNANTGATTTAVAGGTSVTINAGGVTGAANITVGGAGLVSPSGAVTVTETGAMTATGTIGTVTVTGGSSVTVTEAETATAAAAALGTTTVTGGAITFTGSSATTSVSAVQTAAATAVAPVVAVSGVSAVTAVAATPGVKTVTGVAAVAQTLAQAAVTGVVDAAVTITDANGASNTAANTISTVSLTAYGNSTITSSALSTLNLTGLSNATVTANGGTQTGVGTVAITNNNTALKTAASSALTLNVNNVTAATAANDAITDTNNEISTLNIVTSGAASKFAFIDSGLKTLNVSGSQVVTFLGNNTAGTGYNGAGGASLTALNVSGAAGFNDGSTMGAGGTGLSTRGASLIITDTSTGAFTATLDATTQAFSAAGNGASTITIDGTAVATKAIAAGTGVTDELDLGGTGAYAQTATSAALLTGFETIGVGAGLTGPIDMSILAPNASKLHIIGNSTMTFNKVATGAAIQIDAANANTTVNYVDANGASDTTTVTLGKSTTTAGFTVGTLALADANGVGIGTLNINTVQKVVGGVPNTFGLTDTITTLTDNGLSTLNVAGTGGLTITGLNEASTQATSFTLNNTTTNAGAGVTITTLTDSVLGTLTFKGTNVSTIGTLVDSVATLSIVNAGTALATINTITDANITSLTLTPGTGGLSLARAAGLTANVSSLTLADNVEIGATATLDSTKGLQDNLTTGVTINGSADNSHVTVNLTAGAAATKTDTISLGNGNNYILDATTAGTVNITVGTGSNVIDVSKAAAGNATYAANITLGAHNATTGVDKIFVSAIGTNTTVNTIITGVQIGDQIQFTDAATAGPVTTVNLNANTYGTLALGFAAAHAATAAGGVATFLFGGNTYVVEDVAAATAAATSSSIQLMGVHTVSNDTAGLISILS